MATTSNPMDTAPSAPKLPATFDRALAATKFGKFNYMLILLTGMILANVFLESVGMSFVFPVSNCDVGLTLTQRGVVSAMSFTGIVCGSHLWGFLADTTGRRRVIRPTLLMAFVFSILSSFSVNFWQFTTTRLLNGFFVAGSSGTVYVYLSEFHSGQKRSRAIMLASFVYGVGCFLQPCIAFVIINQRWRLPLPLVGLVYKPWRLYIVACGMMGFISGLCLFFIPESPKYVLHTGEEQQCLKILQGIYRWNTGKPLTDFPVERVIRDLQAEEPKKGGATKAKKNRAARVLRKMWKQTSPLFGREHLRSTLMVCLVQFMIYTTANGLYMWYPEMLNTLLQFANANPNNRTVICTLIEERISALIKFETSSSLCVESLEHNTYYYAMLTELEFALAFVFISLIINRVGKKLILLIIMLLFGCCGISVPFVDNPNIAIYLFVTLMLSGVGINILSAITVDLYPTELRAMAISIAFLVGRLGCIFGTNFISFMIVHNCKNIFVSSGSTLILAGLMGLLIPKSKYSDKAVEQSRRESIVSMTGN